MRLNFDLATQLVLDAGLEELFFEEDFESDDELALLLARQVDVAELALAQGLAYFKVLNGPSPLANLLGDADGLSARRGRGSVRSLGGLLGLV